MSDELKRKLLSAWGAPEHDTLCQMRADAAIALIRAETLEEAAVRLDRIEQLEAALREIAAYKADEYDMDWADTIAEMNSIARAALEERT